MRGANTVKNIAQYAPVSTVMLSSSDVYGSTAEFRNAKHSMTPMTKYAPDVNSMQTYTKSFLRQNTVRRRADMVNRTSENT